MRLAAVREQLRQPLPAATLLLGPEPETITQLASEAAQHHGGAYAFWEVTSENVRQVQSITARSNRAGVIALGIDGASDQAQNALLKLLEEPPDGSRFLLLATEVPLPTVASRCRVLMWTEADEVTDREAAERAVDALRAACNHDSAALARLFRSGEEGWGEAEHDALVAWAVERVSGWWQQYAPGEVPLPKGSAMLLLRLMASQSRHWIGDRSALEQVVAAHG